MTLFPIFNLPQVNQYKLTTKYEYLKPKNLKLLNVAKPHSAYQINQIFSRSYTSSKQGYLDLTNMKYINYYHIVTPRTGIEIISAIHMNKKTHLP